MPFELSNLYERVHTYLTQVFADIERTLTPHLAPLTEIPATLRPPQLPSTSQLTELIQSPEIAPFVPYAYACAALIAVVFMVRAPHPFRGPRIRIRDSQRGYKIALRKEIMEAAGHRCESPRVLAWGRCTAAATQVDHIYPWSRGGPTTRTNGQALCADHNRKKNASRPTWWYVLSLERRRKLYYPVGSITRVQAYPRRRKSRRNR